MKRSDDHLKVMRDFYRLNVEKARQLVEYANLSLDYYEGELKKWERMNERQNG